MIPSIESNQYPGSTLLLEAAYLDAPVLGRLPSYLILVPEPDLRYITVLPTLAVFSDPPSGMFDVLPRPGLLPECHP